MDGASNYRIYWNILLPLSKPILATVAVFSFINHWNSFFEPLIYLQNPKKWTMAIGLLGFKDLYATSWNLMMAASTAMILPLLILFFFADHRGDASPGPFARSRLCRFGHFGHQRCHDPGLATCG
jgi:multiple sugar transport system permease protein